MVKTFLESLIFVFQRFKVNHMKMCFYFRETLLMSSFITIIETLSVGVSYGMKMVLGKSCVNIKQVVNSTMRMPARMEN